MKRRTKVSLTIVAGLMGIGLWYSLAEDYGVGVDSVGWLPPEAHNITYLQHSLGRTAEFDIEREPFENWCARQQRPLREVSTEGYHAIRRCVVMLERRGAVPPITEPNEAEANQQKMERVVKVFRAGDLFYEERWANGGGYCIGYDTKERRGYYSFAHR